MTIRDIDPEGIWRRYEQLGRQHGQESDDLASAGSVKAHAEMQRKLLHAVLAQPELLDRFLRHMVGQQALDDTQDELCAQEEDEELLAPAFATLTPQQRQFLESRGRRRDSRLSVDRSSGRIMVVF